MTFPKWVEVGGAVVLFSSIVSGAWWGVTQADEVSRHAAMVPEIEHRQREYGTRIRDLESDAARTAAALEQIRAAQRTNDAEMLAKLDQLLKRETR